jgi:hypothetical protein
MTPPRAWTKRGAQVLVISLCLGGLGAHARSLRSAIAPPEAPADAMAAAAARAGAAAAKPQRALLDYACGDYDTTDGCDSNHICDYSTGLCDSLCSDYETSDGCSDYWACDAGTCTPMNDASSSGCSDYSTDSGCASGYYCRDNYNCEPTARPSSTPSTPSYTPSYTPSTPSYTPSTPSYYTPSSSAKGAPIGVIAGGVVGGMAIIGKHALAARHVRCKAAAPF